ncbi:hypothetical protein D1AOALGA4SA_6730 [Olavius algarvensis Delta 1 endosymbiont]|nr:hypothetical protein D1AOALGA4SA_6730 [Olavius algarvensis Delta 1 endosymbiont]
MISLNIKFLADAVHASLQNRQLNNAYLAGGKTDEFPTIQGATAKRWK